jgi:hypothetical protein
LLTVLSVVLLGVLGLLGEELQNVARAVLPTKCGPSAATALPLPTRFAFDLFGQNSGDFLLSLTPFMMIFGAIGVCARDATRTSVFWSGFVAAWLAALIYFFLYAWAMLLPFHMACADLESRPVVWIVLAIDVVIIVAGIATFRRARQAH